MNRHVQCLCDFGFQSPISGSQTANLLNIPRSTYAVSIPYKRVTNDYWTKASDHVKQVSIPYKRVTNHTKLQKTGLSYGVSIPYKRVTNAKPENSGFVVLLFQSPISGSQTLNYNKEKKICLKVSIPYKRVTNPTPIRISAGTFPGFNPL